MSAVTYFAYAYDKAKAISGGQRIAENTLHLISLAGGWPGALCAQKIYRHKTVKQPFRIIFWFTVILNCAALFWAFTPVGNGLILGWIDQIDAILYGR